MPLRGLNMVLMNQGLSRSRGSLTMGVRPNPDVSMQRYKKHCHLSPLGTTLSCLTMRHLCKRFNRRWKIFQKLNRRIGIQLQLNFGRRLDAIKEFWGQAYLGKPTSRLKQQMKVTVPAYLLSTHQWLRRNHFLQAGQHVNSAVYRHLEAVAASVSLQALPPFQTMRKLRWTVLHIIK